ncbi:hypothetical protein [Umezawaea tangerina]|uniref:Tetratricopeptide repeat protein n=1 Tax=Umezawaea tangerina TaxID=84725 RepID=A0A2T0TEA3_9PSEU|nr:hypothetical protein [Umezawaea tangerina]PRY43990.1 hypothetical protein CLV43_103741 [Umezawaea tangerina]
MEDALPGGEPEIRLTGFEAFTFGIAALDEEAQELLRAGRLAEAADVFRQDGDVLRDAVAAALDAGAVRDEQLDRAVDFRTAHGLRNIGTIEALRVRVDPALDRTAEAVRLLRDVVAAQPEPLVRDEYVQALQSFAFVRALCRTRLAEAADAIAEVLRLLDEPAAGEVSEDFRAGARRLAQQVERIREDMAEGKPTGIPGSALPGTDWRTDLAERARQPALERMDVPDLVRELGNTDQVEALLRMMDERGDADGAHKHGVVLQDRGDLAAAEAAYRRGSERGSHTSAYRLGLLLKDRKDTPGAVAAFEQAVRSDDEDLAAKARRALAKLTRTRRFPWSRG